MTRLPYSVPGRPDPARPRRRGLHRPAGQPYAQHPTHHVGDSPQTHRPARLHRPPAPLVVDRGQPGSPPAAGWPATTNGTPPPRKRSSAAPPPPGITRRTPAADRHAVEPTASPPSPDQPHLKQALRDFVDLRVQRHRSRLPHVGETRKAMPPPSVSTFYFEPMRARFTRLKL